MTCTAVMAAMAPWRCECRGYNDFGCCCAGAPRFAHPLLFFAGWLCSCKLWSSRNCFCRWDLSHVYGRNKGFQVMYGNKSVSAMQPWQQKHSSGQLQGLAQRLIRPLLMHKCGLAQRSAQALARCVLAQQWHPPTHRCDLVQLLPQAQRGLAQPPLVTAVLAL